MCIINYACLVDSPPTTHPHSQHIRLVSLKCMSSVVTVIIAAIVLLMLSLKMPTPTFITDTATHCETLHMKSNTPIRSFREIYRSVANVGDWEGLCLNLDVDEAVMDSLRHSNYARPESKKHDCLQAYWKTGETNWESVIRAVAEYPIMNIKLAKRIASNHRILYTCATRDEF